MHNKYTILRVWKQTAQKLKILAAIQGQSMIAVLDRLIAAECERLHIPSDEGKETSQHDDC